MSDPNGYEHSDDEIERKKPRVDASAGKALPEPPIMFPYTLDPFQLRSIEVLESGVGTTLREISDDLPRERVGAVRLALHVEQRLGTSLTDFVSALSLCKCRPFDLLC
jgi:hypothetical protein